MTSIADARIIELPKIARPQGNITPVEGGSTVPFEIARVYYLYDVPGGASRGAHAHRELEQMLVSAMGGFTVVVDDGSAQREFRLTRAYQALYLPHLLWRRLVDFTSGAVCVVLASKRYERDDYIRDYREFKALKRSSAVARGRT